MTPRNIAVKGKPETIDDLLNDLLKHGFELKLNYPDNTKEVLLVISGKQMWCYGDIANPKTTDLTPSNYSHVLNEILKEHNMKEQVNNCDCNWVELDNITYCPKCNAQITFQHLPFQEFTTTEGHGMGEKKERERTWKDYFIRL